MISYRSILFLLGKILASVALVMYVPALYALFTGGAGFSDFLFTAIFTQLVALALITSSKNHRNYLRLRDMFLLSALVWVVISGVSALPFMSLTHLSLTDAFFESMAGITTTSASVFTHVNTLAPSILLWRSLLQWIGGAVFIMMAVTILPFLNVGGMRLFHSESTDWSEKSVPRIREIAKRILTVYLILTLLCYLGYHLAGMNHFDAINHAFTTVSTGGFSTNDKSLAAYSTLAQWNALIFMLLASLPILAFSRCWQQRSLKPLFQDKQVRGFISLILILWVLLTFWLWFKNIFGFTDGLRVVLFNLVSALSTTGYDLGDFDLWTPFTTIFFAVVILLGGCSGSATGGIKIFRAQICLTVLKTQVLKLIHPNGIFPGSYNARPLTDEINRSIIAFLMAFIGTTIMFALLLGLCGVDPVSAITGAMGVVANSGVALGDLIGTRGSFASLPDIAKWILSVGMLVGRLEVVTMLVLIFPSFWRA